MLKSRRVHLFMVNSKYDYYGFKSIYPMKYQKPNIPAIFLIDLPRSFFYTLAFFSFVDFYYTFSFEIAAYSY